MKAIAALLTFLVAARRRARQLRELALALGLMVVLVQVQERHLSGCPSYSLAATMARALPTGDVIGVLTLKEHTVSIRSTRVTPDRSDPGRSLLSGALFGVGLAGFVDETVFHQLLHWHHFYDKSTPAVGLVSDGLFHALGFFCIVGGLFLFADLRRRDAYANPRWWAGLCFGLGRFQLYDGTIQHKLMGLHQIRYHFTIFPKK